MINRVKRDLEEGIRKLKWFASLLSERVRVEISIFRLLYQSEELKKRRDELLKQIGEEAYEMRAQKSNVFETENVQAAIKEIEDIDAEIKETAEKASELSKITA
jgi:seryl-tRNA synthetase